MPWVVGIDEAGYGPNLGPLVQAAVALRLPDDDLAGWTTLASRVRRCGLSGAHLEELGAVLQHQPACGEAQDGVREEWPSR